MDRLDRLLIESLADGRFHSGNEIAQALGISRTAVWKHVQRLEPLGLKVLSVTGKGYRLESPLSLLSAPSILAGMAPESLRLMGSLQIEDTLDSTNSALMRMASDGAINGTVVLAEYQTHGRGRIGRSWLAPFAGGVCLSLLWRFQDPRQVAGLSLAVGVALVRALKDVGAESLTLKWPNDLLWAGGKLGGILIEIAGEVHGSCAVVIGVGTNLDLPDEVESRIDQAATDLRRVLGGQPPDRNYVIARYLSHLIDILKDYSEKGVGAYLAEWRSLHGDAGKAATIHIGENEVPGKIVDVSPEGFLLFEDSGGTVRTFASGEVRLRVGRDG
jgi:BirA family transcriptional regulator, biotin operon repressor / biotin---[acetyl-CoA-carboxylase] ligase